MKNKLEILFSEVRMNAYCDYNEYLYNIKYSMQLYPQFHIFEIALRNKIDNYIRELLSSDRIYIIEFVEKINLNTIISITELGKLRKIIKAQPCLSKYKNAFDSTNEQNISTYNSLLNQLAADPELQKMHGDNWLLDVYNEISPLFFDISQVNQIKESYQRINKGAQTTHNDILGNLNLGFWVSMFANNFLSKNKFSATTYFGKIFQKRNPSNTEITQIKKEVYMIKHNRNRVFHFEKITKNGGANTILENNLMGYIKYLDKDNILNELLKSINPNIS